MLLSTFPFNFNLRRCSEVDPSLDRTIGVLTKLDLMDKGTDARETLEGRALTLEHGWCAVVNRSQSDINTNVDMRTVGPARGTARSLLTSTSMLAHSDPVSLYTLAASSSLAWPLVPFSAQPWVGVRTY